MKLTLLFLLTTISTYAQFDLKVEVIDTVEVKPTVKENLTVQKDSVIKVRIVKYYYYERGKKKYLKHQEKEYLNPKNEDNHTMQ